MKNSILLFSCCLIISFCTKVSDKPNLSTITGNGVFVINEGNFTWGNGSLSFYSYDSSKIFNNLFYNTNGRPLGDVPNSIGIIDGKGYLLINNSGKIEVVNINTLESLKTINGISSPRNIAFINNSFAYVTCMYSDSVVILDLEENSIAGYINLRRSSEAIVLSGNKAFISSWINGSEVMVISTVNNELVDSITVGKEPESMVVDKNNKLWVLCNGGWARDNYAELLCINTLTNNIEKTHQFPEIEDSPSCLTIDGEGGHLYFLMNGVQRMNINDANLPLEAHIPQSSSFYYKLGINPVNGDIFVTDAVDYQQRGYVLIYKSDGTFVSKHKADVIPGSLCFKMNDTFISE